MCLKDIQRNHEGIDCDDFDDLLSEIMQWGNENKDSANIKQQPRPVSKSKVCKFRKILREKLLQP